MINRWLHLSLIVLVFILFSNCDDQNMPQESGINKDDTTAVSPVVNSGQIKTLTNKIEQEPDNPKWYYTRAQLLLQANDIRAAAQDLQKAIALDSTQAEYYSTLADLKLANKDLDGAILSMQKCIATGGMNADDMLKLAKFYLYKKDYQNAMIFVNNGLRLEVYNAYAYFLKGYIYKELNNSAKAISSFQTAVEQDPLYFDAYMQLAGIYAGMKNRLAVDYYNNALKIDSLSYEALYGRAKFYQDITSFDTAMILYKDILLKHAQKESVYYNLGVIYYQMDSLQKAYNNFNFAIKVNPALTEAYAGMGLCSELLGNKKQAELHFRQSLKLNPDFEIAKEGLKRVVNI